MVASNELHGVDFSESDAAKRSHKIAKRCFSCSWHLQLCRMWVSSMRQRQARKYGEVAEVDRLLDFDEHLSPVLLGALVDMAGRRQNLARADAIWEKMVVEKKARRKNGRGERLQSLHGLFLHLAVYSPEKLR